MATDPELITIYFRGGTIGTVFDNVCTVMKIFREKIEEKVIYTTDILKYMDDNNIFQNYKGREKLVVKVSPIAQKAVQELETESYKYCEINERIEKEYEKTAERIVKELADQGKL